MTDTLASVVKDTPDLAALPAATPANVRRVIERCLRKDPRTRLRDIGEARVLLEEPAEATPAAAIPPATRAGSLWAWIAAGVCAVCLAVLATVHFSEESPKPPGPVRFEIAVPASASIGRFLTLSPDGQTLAWADGGNIYVRAIDGFEPRVLTAANVDGYMFWSPDSRQLGFQAEGKLKRISVAGGAAQDICDRVTELGAAWTHDDRLIIGGNRLGLLRVPVSGGKPEPIVVTGARKDLRAINWPVLLSGGRKLLYTTQTNDQTAAVTIAEFQPDGSLAHPREVLAAQAAQFFTDASGRGHLAFVRGASVMAQAFDPGSGTVSGEPFVLTPAVGMYLTRAFYAVANGGTIVSRSGETVGVRAEFVDRSGKGGDLTKAAPGSLQDVTLSPDGRSILATVIQNGLSTIWALDPERGAHTRLTFDYASSRGPIWSPDGKRIAYWSNGLWVKSANGSATTEKVAPAGLIVWHWSHDGKNLLVSTGLRNDSETGLFLLPLEGDRKRVPLVPSKFVLTQAQFSRDDRWVAYVSDESGESEVYVQRLPATGERIRISNSGGVQPRWSRDGREIFYVEPRGKLMSVALRYGKTIEASAPAPLFDARLSSLNLSASPRYDVTPDGKHFVVSRYPEAQSTSPLRVILNWQGVRE